MFRSFIMTALAALLLAGCGGPKKPDSDSSRRASPKEIKGSGSTPEETFENVRKSLLSGDLETAYFYMSARLKATYSFADFKKDYEGYRDEWDRKLEGAALSQVSIEPDTGQCSAVVLWGDHTRSVVVFVEEGGLWRELGSVWNQQSGY